MTIKILKNATGLMLAFCFAIASQANASHKSGVPPLDFAMKGTNAPGWTSKGDCANDMSGNTCVLIMRNCNGSGYDIYTTTRILKMLETEVKNGRNVVVHTMTDSGHFKDRICSLVK